MVTLARSDDVRRQNTNMILSALRRLGPMSRTALAAGTGLSPATVSTIVSALIGEGIVNESVEQSATARRGRPQVLLGLDPGMATAGAIVLSFDHATAALVDYRGTIIAEASRHFSTRKVTAGDLMRECADLLAGLIRKAPDAGGRLRHVSIGVQGVTDAAGTKMLWSPITPERDVPFTAIFENRFGVPAIVGNDCNMIAEALRWHDPRFERDFAAILLSHGIGMGLVINGAMFGGIRSSAAEFGHMVHIPDGALCRCGQRGCIEAYAGDYAIWRRAHELPEGQEANGGPISENMYALADKARAGAGRERRAYEEAGRAIGFGLRSLFALIDPVPVVFVGSGAVAFDLMEPEIRAALQRGTWAIDASDIPMECFPRSRPLIRQGCVMTSLVFIDRQAVAGAYTMNVVKPVMKEVS